MCTQKVLWRHLAHWHPSPDLTLLPFLSFFYAQPGMIFAESLQHYYLGGKRKIETKKGRNERVLVRETHFPFSHSSRCKAWGASICLQVLGQKIKNYSSYNWEFAKRSLRLHPPPTMHDWVKPGSFVLKPFDSKTERTSMKTERKIDLWRQRIKSYSCI